jgi:hypothetical protein
MAGNRKERIWRHRAKDEQKDALLVRKGIAK